MLNVAPPYGLFSAQSRPPWASTIDRDTAKPIPIPFSFVVTKASKIFSGILDSRAIIDHLDEHLVLICYGCPNLNHGGI